MVLTEPLTKQERMNLYWLTRISGFGAVTINKIWNAVQKKEEIYNIEGMFLKEKGILSGNQEQAFDAFRKQDMRQKIEEEYEGLKEQKIRFFTPFDEEYPRGLRMIHNRPMGLFCKGTMPDNQRFCAAIVGARECSSYGSHVARMLAKELNIDQKSIYAYALGEHGESQMVPWSCASVFGKPLLKLMEEYPDTYGKLDLEKIAADARYGGWLVFKGKGSTEFGIAASCVEIIKTIFSDEKKVCTVAVMLHGEFGQKDVYASVPAIIGRNGVEGIIELEMRNGNQ